LFGPSLAFDEPRIEVHRSPQAAPTQNLEQPEDPAFAPGWPGLTLMKQDMRYCKIVFFVICFWRALVSDSGVCHNAKDDYVCQELSPRRAFPWKPFHRNLERNPV